MLKKKILWSIFPIEQIALKLKKKSLCLSLYLLKYISDNFKN